MSGSSKKKLRKEQRDAVLTEKQRKEKQEAKKLKAYTWTFVIAMVLVVAIVAGIFLQNPIDSLINQNTHAVTIGNNELTIPEFSYFYVDEINNYYMSIYQQYGSYTPYLLGFQMGVSLNQQVYDKETGETWAEFFMSSAAESAQTVFGLYKLALEKGHTLTAEEEATLTGALDELDYSAKKSGYNSTNDYLSVMYGNGATRESYADYSRISAVASSYYSAHSKELHESYTDTDFRKFEEDKIGEFYSYTFLSHTINASDYLPKAEKDENGKDKPYTEEQKAEALAKAKADMEKLMGMEIKDVESFNLALSTIFKKAETSTESTDPTDPTGSTEATTAPSTEVTTEPTVDPSETTGSTGATTGSDSTTTKVPTCTEADRYLYTQLNKTLQDWVKSDKLVLDTLTSLEVKTEKPHEHKEGEEHSDDEEVEYETTGFIVVLMQKVDHNDMKMVNVRHILIEVEKLADSASDKEKEAADLAAKTKAEKLLKEFLDGDKTPESFGKLATANSKDPGSVTTGGLYEDVYPTWAVKEFDEWCFAEGRKVGDTGVVKTDNGYHVMYLESFTERTFRDYMIANRILSEDLEAWLKEIKEATPYVEVDLSRMNWDMMVSG
jgi:parvulin-like peptidyl-prolyl isomerase